jgi:hypothetical protein
MLVDSGGRTPYGATRNRRQASRRSDAPKLADASIDFAREADYSTGARTRLLEAAFCFAASHAAGPGA